MELEESVRTTIALLNTNKISVIFVEEWRLLADIKKVLEPLEIITKEMSGEKYISLSCVIILTKGLQEMLEELKNEELFAMTQTMVLKMLTSIKERLGGLENNNTLLVSTFLDPRFKNIGFSSDLIAEKTKKLVINLVSHKIQQKTIPNNHNPSNSEGNENTNDEIQVESTSTKKARLSIWTHFEKKAASFQPKGTFSSRATLEIQRYLEDGLLDRKEDPLLWWKKHAYNYPYLSKVVLEKFGTVATSVPSERIFSKTGQIITERRSRLTSEKVNKIMFLNVNKT